MQLKKLYRYSIAFFMGLSPILANASVQSSLENIQTTLVGRIGPVVAILGFVFAGFSYVSGSPNARAHLVLAIIGAGVIFGASSIVSFIQSMVN
jgi:type IV secretory pathway VirB2 component (pilin)